jgi:hypothetical protein
LGPVASSGGALSFRVATPPPHDSRVRLAADRGVRRGFAMEDSIVVQCPYCWQSNEIAIDRFGGGVQRYVEDCPVCCQPWQVTLDLRGEEPVVQVEPT